MNEGRYPSEQRETIAEENLSFPDYKMPAEANIVTVYDAKLMFPAPKLPGIVLVAAPPKIPGESSGNSRIVFVAVAILIIVVLGSAFWFRQRHANQGADKKTEPER